MQPIGVDWEGPEALPVWIRAPSEDCPAANALRAEGIPHKVYSESEWPAMWEGLAQIWKHGRAFIHLEHDNVPWPGALDDLVRCRRSHWCGYWYPLGGPGELAPGIGCFKVDTALVCGNPNLWKNWSNTPWHGLDAAVSNALARATGWSEYHLHWPAIAHARPAGGDDLARYA